jgi:hypothetical protein
MEGQRLGGLARQVGEQPPRVGAEMADRLGRVEESLERRQEGGNRGADGLDLIGGHPNPSQGARENLPTVSKKSPAL